LRNRLEQSATRSSIEVIYVGVFLLVILLTIAIGILNGKLKTAVVMALFLRGILIALIVAI
jgi:hypothetical protein